MKIGICDDEKCFIEGTRHLVEEWAKKHNIFVSIYEFTNGDDLISSHQKKLYGPDHLRCDHAAF